MQITIDIPDEVLEHAIRYLYLRKLCDELPEDFASDPIAVIAHAVCLEAQRLARAEKPGGRNEADTTGRLS